MKNFVTVIIMLFTILSSGLIAQDIDIEGYGATGFIFYDNNQVGALNQETYYEGKIQTEMEYNDKIEAQLDFRGNSTDNSIVLREFSLKLKVHPFLYLKIGNLKKPFGYEYLFNREELVTVNRSYTQEMAADLGFGGRSVSVMAYHKYDKGDKLPLTYYISLFKNNGLYAGMTIRGSWHSGNNIISLNYQFQNKGGDNSINSHGLNGGYAYENKTWLINFELFYLQDPVEGIRRRLAGLDENVNAFGSTITAAREFDSDYEFLKKVEPFIKAGIFSPDTENFEYHSIQAMFGANFYLHKKVRARLNGDLRLTKSIYNDEYQTTNSRVILEMQVRF